MADDNSARHRAGDSFGPGSEPADRLNDPLAELARLIGRSDPFSALERELRSAPQPDYASEQFATAHAPPDPAPPSYPREPHFDRRYAAPDYETDPISRPLPGEGDSARPHDPFILPSHHSLRPDETAHFDDRAYAEPHDRPDLYYSDQQTFSHTPERPGFLEALYPQETVVDSMGLPHDDEFYHDAVRPNRRKGLLTVAAVLGLAVLGTAAAFGYRAMFGGVNSSASPPVIRASVEPTKVAPPAQPVDQTASKFSYDRFGDRGQNEQVVSREEQPVDSRELGRTSVPRTTLPGLSDGALGAVGAKPNAPNAPNPPSALGEPRRVRTVPIRPDQPDTAAMPQLARQQPPPMRAAPTSPPSPRQPATVAEAPAETSSTVNPRPASPARSHQRVAHSAVSSGSRDDNAPLSLSPDNNNSPQAALAREAPAPRAAPPPRSAGNGGGYLVQVSSQRSEADAQSSYRSIQSKYSNVLKGHRHLIRRADLGSRGIYYRAMVGPLDSREQAIQLCGSLKAAGGDCVVQAN
jgi:hypothetical protein